MTGKAGVMLSIHIQLSDFGLADTCLVVYTLGFWFVTSRDDGLW
ncbi:MAG: hypothetical protein VKL00_00430 [Synechococcales bacterium]|nr:hypothetical protein [Synechococcales bacterium]